MKSAGSRTTLQNLGGPSTSKKLLACLSYGTVSVSITLFNKAVFSVYGFHYPNFVTTLQIVVSILYMNLLKGVGLFHFAPLTAKGARQVSWQFHRAKLLSGTRHGEGMRQRVVPACRSYLWCFVGGCMLFLESLLYGT
jgi:hypothetical protein